jgi:ethanolamine ammonia-lyase small subunit
VSGPRPRGGAPSHAFDAPDGTDAPDAPDAPDATDATDAPEPARLSVDMAPATARPLVETDAWTALRAFTPARIALGRTGSSQPTSAQLAFGLAHAQARDAVHASLDVAALDAALRAEGFDTLTAHSRAADRPTYLRRPDLGRRLDDTSLAHLRAAAPASAPDLVFVVADGLSAVAVARHAVPLLVAARERLADWSIGPVVIATQARVALGDEAGEALGARAVALLVGERPGLSSPDSLGIYLTWAPRVGRTDAERNCISNVRPEGLAYGRAAATLAGLLQGARRLGSTGVSLKDETGLPRLAEG